MNREKWKVYGLWILLCEAVGVLSGWLSREGMEVYNATAAKPAITPPPWVFPVVWSILFVLMGIGAAKVYLKSASKARSWGLNLFIVQLAVNFFWPLIFFNLQAYGAALVWLILLWILVAAVIRLFWRADKAAAWLLTPYLAWLTFASVLNGMVYIRNG